MLVKDGLDITSHTEQNGIFSKSGRIQLSNANPPNKMINASADSVHKKHSPAYNQASTNDLSNSKFSE